MHAVVEAGSILRTVPRDPDEPKGKWVERAGRIFGLTRSQAKKIIYGEVKDLRATRLDAMRDKLMELRERADAHQARRNELIYARHEIARAGQAHRQVGPSVEPVPQTVRESGEAGSGVGPRSAATSALR